MGRTVRTWLRTASPWLAASILLLAALSARADPPASGTKVLYLYVADLGGPGSGPVAFLDGTASSGLTYTFEGLADGGDGLAFSSDHGTTWTLGPVAGGDGTDPQVTDLGIHPQGSFNPDNAQFTVKYRVRLR